MFVGLLIFLGLALTLNTGIAFATENTSGNHSSSYGFTSTTTSNNISTTNEGTIDYTTGSSTQTYSAAGSGQTIKVLIYSGSEASTNCVNGIINALDYANTYNVISNVLFSYTTSTVINSATLTGYDVLAMPGGSGGYYYLNSGSISGSAIKNFVASGNGYIGICAGAYSAAAHTDYYYDGWGIAPDVRCKPVAYEGALSLQITSAGQEVLGTSGTKTLVHYNGPAMYVSGNAVTFATYADSSTGYKGYAAIVGDYYGNGRVVLCGPHPELSSLVPTFVSKLIYWAANGSSSTSTVTVKHVTSAGYRVQKFTDKYGRLPGYVLIDDTKYSMPEFLYLAAKANIQINSGSTSSITPKSIDLPSSLTGSYTYTSGNILKSEYSDMASRIVSFMNTYGRAPNYVSCSLGKISYSSVVYMFSKIMNFYNSNARLPNYVSM